MSDVRFFHPHITYVDRSGNYAETRCTVAYCVDEESLILGASFCSPKDRFARKLGRELALERYYVEPTVLGLKGVDLLSGVEIIALIRKMVRLLPLPGVPHRWQIVQVD